MIELTKAERAALAHWHYLGRLCLSPEQTVARLEEANHLDGYLSAAKKFGEEHNRLQAAGESMHCGDVYSNGKDTVYVPRETVPQIGDMMFVPDGPWTPTGPGWGKNADGYWQRRVVEGDYGPMGQELYNSMVDPVTGLPEQKPDQADRSVK